MSTKSRWLIVCVSTPLVILAAVGGLLGASQTGAQQSFKDLRVFDDVRSLIATSYVERVDLDKVMEGAMRGLTDGLDASSAYLSADEVKAIDAGTPLPAGDIGLTISRRFYLRIIGVRDGSPAARAGLRTDDFIRGIDGKPTREVSAYHGYSAASRRAGHEGPAGDPARQHHRAAHRGSRARNAERPDRQWQAAVWRRRGTCAS